MNTSQKTCHLCGKVFTAKRCSHCAAIWNKRYMELHPEKVKQTRAESRLRNREKRREGDRKRQRRRTDRNVQANAFRREILSAGDVTREQLIDLFEKSGEKCHYCHERITRPNFNPLTTRRFDHKIPLSKGGKHTISNIVPCCYQCNMTKNNKTDDEYFKYLAKLTIPS